MIKKIFYLFLIFYIILWVIWWFRLNEVDKIVLKDIMYSLIYKDGFKIFNMVVPTINFLNPYESFIGTLNEIYEIFMLPFKSADRIAINSEGGMYVIAQVMKDPEPAINMTDKVWLYNFFNNNRILSPKIYYYSKNNKIEKINSMPDNIDVIVKPINGIRGLHVKKMSSKNALAYIKENNNMMIQELIRDYSGKVRHFRVVTTSTGDIFLITSYTLPSNKKGIASNHASGGIINNCFNGDCIEGNNKFALNNIGKQLQDLHTHSEFVKYYSIGWDIIISSNNHGFPTAYCLEGNIPHGSSCFTDFISNDLMNKYREGFIKEYKH